jgi:hypothetical protein
MNALNKELKEQAVKLGLCEDWQKLWSKDWSHQKMVEQMYKGLDFCLLHHYPSNDFIIKHFDIDFLRESNVFVNDKYSVVNPKESLVLGTSDVTFRYNCHSYGNIHVRDNSSAKVIARNASFVIVHIYENASVTAEQCNNAKIVLVKHSNNAHIVAPSNIKVREEYDYLK